MEEKKERKNISLDIHDSSWDVEVVFHAIKPRSSKEQKDGKVGVNRRTGRRIRLNR